MPLAEYKFSFMCDLAGKEKLKLGFFPGFLSGFKWGNVVWVFHELWNLWNTHLKKKQLCNFPVS